ncbi:MAG: methylase involved in ubiquinone/menaquinone biosynthesis [Frankiales bacterium]|nr:methylase involved in ubiquinone/menaquinone biosynthesis [Frankiales bacterium]
MELVALLPQRKLCLLDVGCGNGGFGQALRRLRPDVEAHAIEPSPTSAQAAKPHYTSVTAGSWPEAAGGQHYDVIAFNDVLEHLVDPWETLREASRLLTDNGRLLASIPNIRYAPVLWDLVVRGRWDYVETGTLDRTHLRFFTRSSISRAFAEAGYDVLVLQAVHPAEGRKWRWLRFAPRSWQDFRFLQFVVLAAPAAAAGA